MGHRRQLLQAIAELRAADAKTASDRISQLSQANASLSGSTAERRQLSVIFCDVIDFTALSSRIDPEDLSAVIRGYQSLVATTIARFGGFVARYVGDGILIYFGWPEAHEANAESAVRAALAVVDAIARTSVMTVPLQVRIGIATGLVVVGEPIGTGEARQQTAIGETPNLAARLQGLAEPNSVVVDALTHRQIGGLFEYRDLGDPEVLAAANLPAARRLFVTIPQAFEAGQVVQQARAASAALEIVARAHTDAEVQYLTQLDADLTVMGEREIAHRMIERALQDDDPDQANAATG